MKKLFFFLISFLLLITGCEKTEKIQSESRKSMINYFKEYAKNPESVKFKNIEYVYTNDSLCIIHADFIAKNDLGIELTDRIEYLYLISEGNSYEDYDALAPDSIYISTKAFDKIKKGKIYEDLKYDEAIRFLSAKKIMKSGRIVGDKENSPFEIKLPLKTGFWELSQFKDQFGDSSNSNYIYLADTGIFSNSTTTESPFTVFLFMTPESAAFKLFENHSYLVEGDPEDDIFLLYVKDSKGEIHNFYLITDEDGELAIPKNIDGLQLSHLGYCLSEDFYPEYEEIFIKILEQEGAILCNIEKIPKYGSHSTYRFKLDIRGYNEAIKKVN